MHKKIPGCLSMQTEMGAWRRRSRCAHLSILEYATLPTRIRAVCSVIAAAALLAGGCPCGSAQALPPSFAARLIDVAQLPRLRPVARVGSFSSYDRTGGNDDGNSGRFLRKEGDGLVVAEVTGPGAITRIWTPTPINAPIEFYFDGELSPRLALPFSEVFSGKTPPFAGSLTGHGAGGYYSYVPLEFAKSIKIVIRSELLQFYMVNYLVYEPGVPVRTFAADDSFRVPSVQNDGSRLRQQHVLPAGDTITLFETKRPGRIQSLRLAPADAFASRDRDVVLRIYWDGAKDAAVNVPVGDFFGYSFGQPATHSLLLGTEGGWNYVRFPMPFEQAARIELASERKGGLPLYIHSEVVVSGRGKTPEEGTFHAEWRRENPTITGLPFTYLDVTGRGHLVAATLQSQGRDPGQTYFFEGDDEATVDGDVAIRGTGSEDSFNGGFYGVLGRWYGRASLPFSGCLEYNKHISRTGGYRLFIGDAYSFHRNLRYTIEHSGDGNNIAADYVGTTYYYLDRAGGNSSRNSSMFTGAASRAVFEPASFVLTFFPSPPVIAALMRTSLELHGSRMDGAWVTVASLALSTSADLPNGSVLGKSPNTFDSDFGPPVMALSVEVPKAGGYAIFVDGLTGPRLAMLQLRVNDQPVGNAVDFYAPTPGRSGEQKLAELHLTEGRNLLYFTLPGKNNRSVGSGVDLISIRGTRLR